MARKYSVTTGSVALAAATAKTVVEISTGAGVLVEIIQLDITFNGVTATAVPVTVDFIRATTGVGTAFTPVPVGKERGVAQCTAKINDTTEPTAVTVLGSIFVPPTSGLVGYQFPLGREIYSLVASEMFGIRLTAPAAVTALVNATIEE